MKFEWACNGHASKLKPRLDRHPAPMYYRSAGKYGELGASLHQFFGIVLVIPISAERQVPQSKTPIRQWGFRQHLPFSWTTLRCKHCLHPVAVMGIVDTIGLYPHQDFCLPVPLYRVQILKVKNGGNITWRSSVNVCPHYWAMKSTDATPGIR